MKRDKRMVGILAATAVVVAGTLAVGIGVTGKNQPQETSITVGQTAQMDERVVENLLDYLSEASTEQNDVKVVTKGNEPENKEEALFVANVTDTLNIRAEADAESELVGKMGPECGGKILAVEGEWTKISSGDVEGYVKSEFIVTGEEAKEKAKEVGFYQGTIIGDLLRIREEANAESKVLDVVAKDQVVRVIKEEHESEWVHISLDDGTEGYVAAEFITVEFQLKKAISREEELAQIAAEQARLEAEKQAQEQAAAAKKGGAPAAPTPTNEAPVAANYDDAYLLACLVSMEAGNECYEGQLAVANVVMNRLRSGRWGSSIHSVIYASGQFPSVNGSVMNGYLAGGPLASAQQAANEAMAGNNNIGGYMCFINVSRANLDSYSSYVIIGNHCFY